MKLPESPLLTDKEMERVLGEYPYPYLFLRDLDYHMIAVKLLLEAQRQADIKFYNPAPPHPH